MRNEPWIHEVVMKFLPPQFPWNWCKCLGRNFIYLKIFNMTKYIEVLVKYATPGRGTTNGFIFQTINSKIESWGYTWPALTVRLKSMKFVRFVKCLFGHSHFGNSFSHKKEKDVASIVPWAEITSVPYSRVARWTFETSDMGFILLQRQNSWFATTWRGQYNRIFFSQRKEMLLFLTTNMAAVASRANQQSHQVLTQNWCGIYSYFERGCRKKCARDNPKR